ncbi:MAG: prolyl oligopeptidase family serine peptidase [Longimicrobiales bacterium]|nr:prolyl oligopeptidase family serine peptidase [Longimicrobiales bacterium]
MRARIRAATLVSRISLLFLLLLALPASAQQKKALTFTDLMQIRQVAQPSISADGRWIALTAQPDRGDPEVLVHGTRGETRYAVALGSNPVLSKDGAWVAMRLNPTLEATEKAKAGEAPRRGMALLATAGGQVTDFPEVQGFAFSADGAWMAYHRFEPKPDSAAKADVPKGKRKAGSTLILRELASGRELEVAHVRAFAVSPEGRHVAYAVASPDNARDGLYVRDLGASGEPERTVHAAPFGHYANLTWSEDGALAFVAATEDADGEAGPGAVLAWTDGTTKTLVAMDAAPQGWFVPVANELRWSDDGARLFFGWRPERPDEAEKAATAAAPASGTEAEPFDPYDTEAILAGRGVDVWHWKDPRINPQQKIVWPREKDRTYRAVHHMADGRTVALAGLDLPEVDVPATAGVALGRSELPYQWESTWTGGAFDLYVIGLTDGKRTLVASRLGGRPFQSPGGGFALYWNDGHYHLYDVATGTTRNVTEGLPVSFANEDHDTPDEPGGYGIGGWTTGDDAVLVYDKFDIWAVPTDGASAWMLTEGAGRRESRQFRVVDTDPDVEAIGRRDALLLSSYHDLKKNYGFWRARVDRPGVTVLLEEERRFAFEAKAEDEDVVMFTREDYDEFPNLWVAGIDLRDARRVTDVNPSIADFAWGTSELVEWHSADGRPLQGVVILPGNYEPGKRYPVLVYYYELFSQRLHEFNEPAVNHRPSFPLYASNGYVVFLPDVRFEIGRPGYSATKAIVPGVQHLIDIGVADPDAVALHGHSWSGYQTAQVVTQTDIFRTAIAGAPVGNMTSAYSGIRWGSGVARQFQYEQGQSRLTGSLWEARDEYIDNSPVFFADRIKTPLLLIHGDKDDAVPWYQSIELYLALRRLGKETVFLEYRDEPHHPQKYANKLDWATKMKEWLDYYLKGAPPAPWITEGAPYAGR